MTTYKEEIQQSIVSLNHNKCKLPILSKDIFDKIVDYIIQAFQTENHQNLVSHVDVEIDELPNVWKRYNTIKPSELLFCIETSLFIWINGLLLKYAVDLELVKSSLFEPQYTTGHEIYTEFTRLTNIFPEKTLADEKYSWWWKSDSGISSEVWNLIKTPLTLSEIRFLDGNIISDLYMEFFPQELRKTSGEFYTDRRIIEYILDWVGYTSEQNRNARGSLSSKCIIDPACGAGSFLISALKRYFQDYIVDNKWVTDGISDLIMLKRVVGVDINPFACSLARLGYFVDLIPYLILAKIEQNKFPEIPSLPIIHADSLINLDGEIVNNSYDYVVSNPPYVRIQKINSHDTKQSYLSSYVSAVGRFDLYSLFIERGLQLLKSDGILGYITSNKFMTTNAGKGIRQVISKRATIKHLFDLSDTKVFEAAVLPCVLILKNCKNKNETFPFGLLRETIYDKNLKNVSDVFNYIRRYIAMDFYQEKVNIQSNLTRKVSLDMRIIRSLQPQDDGDSWHFLSPAEQSVIDGIEVNDTIPLGKISKIISGLKTTADSVFIHPMTASFIEKLKLEKDLIYPFIQASNIDKWKIQWTGTQEKIDTYVLYPHLVTDNKVVAINLNDYPNTSRYLKSHYERLSNRQYLRNAGRKWYEIWVTQNPTTFQKQFKIVTPDIKTRNTFALDTNGYMSGTSCFAIFPNKQTKEVSFYLLGILNSDLLDFYHKVKASTFIYSGRYRYWKSYLINYPIIDCHLGTPKLEEYWLKMKPLISDVCKLEFQNGNLNYDRIPISLPCGTNPTTFFRFALQKEIVSEVERILSSDVSMLSITEARLNDLVFHLYQLDDFLRSIVDNNLRHN